MQDHEGDANNKAAAKKKVDDSLSKSAEEKLVRPLSLSFSLSLSLFLALSLSRSLSLRHTINLSLPAVGCPLEKASVDEAFIDVSDMVVTLPSTPFHLHPHPQDVKF